jgi:SAM-dependent methyltransferase
LAISDLFSRRSKPEHDPAEGGADTSSVVPTKALPRFLATLSSREQPSLVDLGPVVGQNVTFFGEQLGCKIFVEDTFKDIDRHAREGKLAELPAFLEKRFPQATDSVDGILCWDVFDYLERPAAQALATQLTRILRPDGVLLAIFSSLETKGGPPTFTKHVVEEPATLRHRPYPAAVSRQRPLLNRDIIRMFEPMRVAEQFLLKTNLREVLFRKPAA